MKFDVSLKQHVADNEISVSLNVPPGDIPYYVNLIENEEDKIISISFKYQNDEPEKHKEIIKDKAVEIIVSKITGRIYQIKLSSEDKKLVDKIKISKQHMDYPKHISRIPNNIDNGENIARKSFEKFIQCHNVA